MPLYLKNINTEKSLIYLKYYVAKDKKYFTISTKQTIKVSEWDFKSQSPLIIRGRTDLHIIRQKTNDFINKLELVINQSKLSGEDITIDFLKKSFTVKNNYKPILLLECLEEFIEIKSGANSTDWLEKYQNIYKKLSLYEKSIFKKIKFEMLDEDFFNNYSHWLRVGYRYRDNTLSRHITFIKTFLIWANKKGYNKYFTYKDFNVSKKESDNIALTKKELSSLENLKLTGVEERVRDVFLIGCYTGQRFSDFSVFEKADVVDGVIIKRSEKSEILCSIPLTNKLTKILDKYNWDLRVYTNQFFNRCLREVCCKAQMNELYKKVNYIGNEKDIQIGERWRFVSSHTARRTFITLASEGGMPDHLIMQVAGIKDIKTLFKYKKADVKSAKEFMVSVFD